MKMEQVSTNGIAVLNEKTWCAMPTRGSSTSVAACVAAPGNGANGIQITNGGKPAMKIPCIDTGKQHETTEGVTTMIRYGWLLFLAMLAAVLATPARAQDDQAAELAKQLSNPVRH